MSTDAIAKLTLVYVDDKGRMNTVCRTVTRDDMTKIVETIDSLSL